jgi:hypothetical protein
MRHDTLGWSLKSVTTHKPHYIKFDLAWVVTLVSDEERQARQKTLQHKGVR